MSRRALADLTQSAVTSTLGAEDNARFLEHFRYIIIAAHLLDEHIGPGSDQVTQRASSDHSPSIPKWSANGVVITAAVAFLFAWLLHWTKGGSPFSFLNGKTALVLTCLPIFALLAYAHGRRSWLKYLRTQAIDSVIPFTGRFRSLESAASSALALVQEVELVSRGYRISGSGPMPPITRLEGPGQIRRCLRLRKASLALYEGAVSGLSDAIVALNQVADQADLERFLEVYDVSWQDLQVAKQGFTEPAAAMDDDERFSLKALRLAQFRLSVLRRLCLCSLLSLPATGRKADSSRWRTAISQMDKLAQLFSELTSQLTKALDSEEMATPSTPSPRVSQSPQHAHLQSQVRRISGLTSSIRSLQAKLWLLREDSTRALSSSNSEVDVLAVSTSLREQYEALGSDLRTLMQAWESGKQALAQDISRHSRRVSTSNALPTPSTPTSSMRDSLGLATLIEDPHHALRQLNGDDTLSLPLSPPTTEDGSNDERGEAADDVFEGVSAPPARERSSLTREQRIKQMKDERQRAASARESREAGQTMVQELQSVIKMRPPTQSRRPRRTSAAARFESQHVPLRPHERLPSL